MKPDISIVIPAYNLESYVKQAIDSALAQRGVNVEVIVVDDGSTDGTAAVLNSYADRSEVRIISQVNTGPSISRNVGIAAATGRHIGFLDGDDLWHSDKARLHLEMLDAHPSLDVTYSWWQIIDDQGQATQRTNTQSPTSLPAGMGFEGLIVENFTGTASTVICRREAVLSVGGFDPDLRSNVDLDFLLRVALLRDGNIGLVPRILTSYRIHSSQITSDWRRMKSNWEKVLDKMQGLAPERIASVERLACARVSRYLAYIAYIQGDHGAARNLLARAWQKAPTSMLSDRRAWLTTLAVAATILPASMHDRLFAAANAWRGGSAA